MPSSPALETAAASTAEPTIPNRSVIRVPTSRLLAPESEWAWAHGASAHAGRERRRPIARIESPAMSNTGTPGSGTVHATTSMQMLSMT